MSFDVTNPNTWLLLLPVGFILVYLITWIISKFSSSKVQEIHLEDAEKFELKTEIDTLKTSVATTIEQLNELRAKIYYAEKEKQFKMDFKNKLFNITNKYINSLQASLEKVMKEKKVVSRYLREIDEYETIRLKLFNIRYMITKKGMDDFDRNNFHKIGITINGEPDIASYIKYIKEKPEQFLTEIRNVIVNSISSSSRFICGDPELEENYKEKVRIIEDEEFIACIEKTFDEISKEISDIYEELIINARLTKGKAERIRGGVEPYEKNH